MSYMSDKKKKDWNSVFDSGQDGVKDFFKECRAIFGIILVVGS